MSEMAERRNSDAVVNLMRDRMDSIERQGKETADGLKSHVENCAQIQRYVLIGIAALGVLHSPEAVKIAIELVEKLR